MYDESELIREGFICPECQEDLTSFDLLQRHFELKHKQNLLQYDKSNGAISSNNEFIFIGQAWTFEITWLILFF